MGVNTTKIFNDNAVDEIMRFIGESIDELEESGIKRTDILVSMPSYVFDYLLEKLSIPSSTINKSDRSQTIYGVPVMLHFRNEIAVWSQFAPMTKSEKNIRIFDLYKTQVHIENN